MDVKRHNGNVLPKKPRTNVRGFLIFRGCATKTGKSPSSNNPASDVRNTSVAIRNKPTCVWKKNPTGLLAGFSVVERRHSPRKNCRRAV